jgi:hypothetical protein
MRKKGLVLGIAIALVWAGSLWMAFWSGFTCHLSATVVGDRVADRARLAEHKWLLQKIDSGQADSARQSLSELVKFDGQRIGIDKQMPPFGFTDIAFAGLTSPREFIVLLRVVREAEGDSETPSNK